MAHAHDPRGPLPNLLDRLDKVKRHPDAGSGIYWTARCPAHQDRNPSLSISEGTDGRVLLNCHAGCQTSAIVRALGLTEADLFEPREPRREQAVYRYEDETGRHLYDVVRFEPKTFRQRRPDGAWGLGDTRRVIYRLPQVRAAIERGDPVYIVEGEKDVHAIEKAGATATTNPMGAGKWRSEYNEQLAGCRNAIIVADTDDPGIAHAGHVAQHLEQAGIPSRIVLPAAGKDAADHLQAGNTLAELVPRIHPPAETSPFQVETWSEFAAKATEEVPCIVQGLWPEGAIGFIASPPKKGKTWLALALALSVASGRDYLNAFPVATPRPVLYIALEGHRSALAHRIGALARGIGIDPTHQIPNLHIAYKPRGINMASPDWANHIAQAATDIDAQLVIVDVLRAAATLKENSAEEFAKLVSNLAPLLDGVRSLGFLHHFTKLNESTKERDPGERMSGSGAMYGALDVGVYITGSDNNARTLRVAFEARDIASPAGLGLQLEGVGSGRNGGFNQSDSAWWKLTEAPDEDDLVAPAFEIKEWLGKNGGEATESQIAAAFGVVNKTINRRRPKLAQLGVEWYAPRGKVGVYRVTSGNADPGHDPGQDTPDRVQGQLVSDLNPSIHAENAEPRTTPDTNPCPTPKTPDLQDKHTPDTPDSPTERDLPVSGVSPETHEYDLLDDDIPW